MEESEYFTFDRVKRNKPGQTSCNNCQKVYNNAAIPELCTQCNSYIPTGKFVSKKSKPSSQAYLISDSLASVRVRPTGHSTRTFVTIGTEKKVKYINNHLFPKLFMVFV